MEAGENGVVGAKNRQYIVDLLRKNWLIMSVAYRSWWQATTAFLACGWLFFRLMADWFLGL